MANTATAPGTRDTTEAKSSRGESAMPGVGPSLTPLESNRADPESLSPVPSKPPTLADKLILTTLTNHGTKRAKRRQGPRDRVIDRVAAGVAAGEWMRTE